MKSTYSKKTVYSAFALSAFLLIPHLALASVSKDLLSKDTLSKVIESHISSGKYLGKTSDTKQDCVVTVGSYGAGSKNISIKIEDMEDFSQLDGHEPLVLFDFTDKMKEIKREVKNDGLFVEIKDDKGWLKSQSTLLDVSGSDQKPITIKIEENYGFFNFSSKSISCEITNESRLSEKISFQN